MTGQIHFSDPRPRVPRPPAAGAQCPGIAFALFLALTAVMLIRPNEIVVPLYGTPIFQGVIILCLLVTFPWVLDQLRLRSLASRPITPCLFGMAAVIPTGAFGAMPAEEALGAVWEFMKVIIYYLLLVAVTDTPRRLRTLLIWVCACLAVHSGLALLNYYKLIDVPNMDSVSDRYEDAGAGEMVWVPRMCGVGLFGNPNDLARILAIGVALALYALPELPRPLAPVVIGLIGMFLVGMTETYSRGGLLALATTLGILLLARLGRVKGTLLGLAALPVGLAMFGGRQTEMSTSEGTGQQRLQLWIEGFGAIPGSPIVGLGMHRYLDLTDGLEAHNSIVESYVELGLVGGTCFLSALILAVWQTHRLRPDGRRPPDLQLARARPFILAVVGGYAVGMLSSSRNYAMTTYLVLGLAAAYQRLAASAVPRLTPRLDRRMLLRLVVVSLGVVSAIYLYARTNVNFGK